MFYTGNARVTLSRRSSSIVAINLAEDHEMTNRRPILHSLRRIDAGTGPPLCRLLRRGFKFSIQGRVLVAHWPRASGDSTLLHTPCHSSTCPAATLEPSSGPPPVLRMKSLARRALSAQGTLHISP